MVEIKRHGGVAATGKETDPVSPLAFRVTKRFALTPNILNAPLAL